MSRKELEQLQAATNEQEESPVDLFELATEEDAIRRELDSMRKGLDA